ncbi:hypothetical protein IHE44_0007583 [Lamprotornis superbus]|uniref:DUF4795 domain-containing protein n=1 Tax=Lamprotornis superbus TaxID=245042 RepID=A0A835NYK0_9PASS|nr:hypothetical protein IHE44_0007583 [Lamprotornis superbus]
MAMLFQSLEKLQKEKADEQDMLAAIDVKADKAALGSKVNCSQFEANMERLHERMQELQSQISDQEQQWNQVQHKLSFVEEEKLDRQELKNFSNQMVETWNRSIEELENRLARDKAAGIKNCIGYQLAKSDFPKSPSCLCLINAAYLKDHTSRTSLVVIYKDQMAICD